MIPTVGRIVHYRLTAQDVAEIGAKGNCPREGEIYPAVIVRNWCGPLAKPDASQAVQLKVMLDAGAEIWKSSNQQQADEDGLPMPGHWAEPVRIA